MFKLLSSWPPCSLARRPGAVTLRHACCRGLADASKSDSTNKHVVVQGTEDACGLRVRRARPSDTARVLRFVREHVRSVWPHAVPPAPHHASALLLADHLCKALAQGHSMVAEQTEGRRGWSRVRGLALGAAVCPWDADLLDRCARCVKCPRARRSLAFAAHCLRAPRLHDKYHVHRYMQVMMIVPQEQGSLGSELVPMLVRSMVQRASDAGMPLVRVDVTNQDIAKILEDLQFKKEWHMEYQVLAENMFEPEMGTAQGEKELVDISGKDNTYFVSVYSAPMDTTAGDEIIELPPSAGIQT